MLSHGNDGWVRYEERDVPGAVYVRLDGDGAVIAVHLDRGGWPIVGAEVRNLPLAKIRSLAADSPEGRPEAARGVEVVHAGGAATELIEKAFSAPRGQSEAIDVSAKLSPDSPADGLTDDFLTEVAHAYRAAVARGERPNKALAEQSRYPVRTVERWVYLARKKGLLAPTKPGSVG